MVCGGVKACLLAVFTAEFDAAQRESVVSAAYDCLHLKCSIGLLKPGTLGSMLALYDNTYVECSAADRLAKLQVTVVRNASPCQVVSDS